VAILVGGLAELATIQAELRDAAAQEERRRLARDLHDGVAQDLAFILQFGRHLAARGEPAPALERLVAAAQGALDESRHAISALRRAPGVPLSEALVLTAREIAEREGGEVRATVDPSVSVPQAAEEALLRIAREASVNAFRHGAARTLHIELSAGQRLRLVITDDGRGFEVPAGDGAPGRLGLLTMRERAEEIGAELSIVSAPGRGTTVEVCMR
jgi:signal transduction histidine kinase